MTQPTKKALNLPAPLTLNQATKLSIKSAKPIDFYFYVDSLKKKISICNDGENKIIFKDEDEHSSPILNTYRCGDEFIIVTENSIYIVSSSINID